MVSMHAFNSDYSSSNLDKVYNLYCIKIAEKNEDKRKRGQEMILLICVLCKSTYFKRKVPTGLDCCFVLLIPCDGTLSICHLRMLQTLTKT